MKKSLLCLGLTLLIAGCSSSTSNKLSTSSILPDNIDDEAYCSKQAQPYFDEAIALLKQKEHKNNHYEDALILKKLMQASQLTCANADLYLAVEYQNRHDKKKAEYYYKKACAKGLLTDCHFIK